MNNSPTFDERWLAESFARVKLKQPYWHPLGFVNCTLEEATDFSVRIHFWPRNDRRPKQPAWPIHTHTYLLKSVVLSGSLTDCQYERAGGSVFDEFAVKYNERGSDLISSGKRTAIRCISKRVYSQGDRYEVGRDVLHETIVPDSQETFTLVTCVGELRGSPVVLGERVENFPTYLIAPYSLDSFWKKIGELQLI